MPHSDRRRCDKKKMLVYQPNPFTLALVSRLRDVSMPSAGAVMVMGGLSIAVEKSTPSHPQGRPRFVTG